MFKSIYNYFLGERETKNDATPADKNNIETNKIKHVNCRGIENGWTLVEQHRTQQKSKPNEIAVATAATTSTAAAKRRRRVKNKKRHFVVTAAAAATAPAPTVGNDDGFENVKLNRTDSSNNESSHQFVMEGSWFVTPPPCFSPRSGAVQQLHTSPIENLLIEHPSMSVYLIDSNNHSSSIRNSTSSQSFSKQQDPRVEDSNTDDDDDDDEIIRQLENNMNSTKQSSMYCIQEDEDSNSMYESSVPFISDSHFEMNRERQTVPVLSWESHINDIEEQIREAVDEIPRECQKSINSPCEDYMTKNLYCQSETICADLSPKLIAKGLLESKEMECFEIQTKNYMHIDDNSEYSVREPSSLLIHEEELSREAHLDEIEEQMQERQNEVPMECQKGIDSPCEDYVIENLYCQSETVCVDPSPKLIAKELLESKEMECFEIQTKNYVHVDDNTESSVHEPSSLLIHEEDLSRETLANKIEEQMQEVENEMPKECQKSIDSPCEDYTTENLNSESEVIPSSSPKLIANEISQHRMFLWDLELTVSALDSFIVFHNERKRRYDEGRKIEKDLRCGKYDCFGCVTPTQDDETPADKNNIESNKAKPVNCHGIEDVQTLDKEHRTQPKSKSDKCQRSIDSPCEDYTTENLNSEVISASSPKLIAKGLLESKEMECFEIQTKNYMHIDDNSEYSVREPSSLLIHEEELSREAHLDEIEEQMQDRQNEVPMECQKGIDSPCEDYVIENLYCQSETVCVDSSPKLIAKELLESKKMECFEIQTKNYVHVDDNTESSVHEPSSLLIHEEDLSRETLANKIEEQMQEVENEMPKECQKSIDSPCEDYTTENLNSESEVIPSSNPKLIANEISQYEISLWHMEYALSALGSSLVIHNERERLYDERRKIEKDLRCGKYDCFGCVTPRRHFAVMHQFYHHETPADKNNILLRIYEIMKEQLQKKTLHCDKKTETGRQLLSLLHKEDAAEQKKREREEQSEKKLYCEGERKSIYNRYRIRRGIITPDSRCELTAKQVLESFKRKKMEREWRIQIAIEGQDANILNEFKRKEIQLTNKRLQQPIPNYISNRTCKSNWYSRRRKNRYDYNVYSRANNNRKCH